MTTAVLHGLLATTFVAGTGGLTMVARNASRDRDPPSGLVTDPRMVTARAVRDHMVEHEDRIATQMQKVLESLARAKNSPAPNRAMPVADLQKLIPPLQSLSRQVLDDHYRLVESTNEFLRELRHTPDGYAQAATAWTARAEDYTHPGLKALPLGYAADCATLESVYRDRLQQVEEQAKQLNELLPFLRETRMSLQDFKLYLGQNPDIGAIDPWERYSGYLELDVNAHARFQTILQSYLAILRTPVPNGSEAPLVQ